MEASGINSQANCGGAFPQIHVRGNKFSRAMAISCREMDAVQRAREDRGFRAVKTQNQIAKTILLSIHWNKNNRPSGNIGEELLKNYIC